VLFFTGNTSALAIQILNILENKLKLMRRIIKAKLEQITNKVFLVIVLCFGGLASCTYYTNDFDPSEAPDGVSFEADVIPIFEAKCNSAGCHNGSIAPDLRADAAYVNLLGLEYVVPGEPAEDSELYQVVIDGGTMAVYASDLERSYIKKWIDEGAENN
jgi:hypothetical protein